MIINDENSPISQYEADFKRPKRRVTEEKRTILIRLYANPSNPNLRHERAAQNLVQGTIETHYWGVDTRSSSPSDPGPRPLAVRVADASRLAGIGKTKLFELIADGTLETTSIGRRRLILYRSLQRLIEGPADL